MFRKEIPWDNRITYFDSTWFLVSRAGDQQPTSKAHANGVKESSKPVIRDIEDFRYSSASHGGTLPRYVFGCTKEQFSDAHQAAVCGVSRGWSLPLPPQVHRLVLKSDARRLKKARTFFVYYNRRLPIMPCFPIYAWAKNGGSSRYTLAVFPAPRMCSW